MHVPRLLSWNVHFQKVYMALYFIQPLNLLKTEAEEQQLDAVLERLKTEVRTRRLMLYPYFRDYDRVSSHDFRALYTHLFWTLALYSDLVMFFSMLHTETLETPRRPCDVHVVRYVHPFSHTTYLHSSVFPWHVHMTSPVCHADPCSVQVEADIELLYMHVHKHPITSPDLQNFCMQYWTSEIRGYETPNYTFSEIVEWISHGIVLCTLA